MDTARGSLLNAVEPLPSKESEFSYGRAGSGPKQEIRRSDHWVGCGRRNGGPRPDDSWTTSVVARSRKEIEHRTGIAFDGMALRQCAPGRTSAGLTFDRL